MRAHENKFREILASFVLALLVVLGSAGLAAQTKPLVNVDADGLGLHGYDPVAYFAEGRAVKGDPQFRASFGGSTYYFKSSANQAAFEREPNRYAPRYGGYCAMAMAMGKLEDIDPNQFLVHDGKLMLQRNEKAHLMFAKDPAGNSKKADENWAKLQSQRGN